MSNLGVGVMLRVLSGGSRWAVGKGVPVKGDNPVVQDYFGTIQSARIDGEENLVIEMDGYTITMRDKGQSCCEYRHMSTDDDLDSLVGQRLLEIDLASGPDVEDDWGGVHEQEFLVLKTDKDTVTIVNHNEHNGYYGGFWIAGRIDRTT